MPSQLRIPVGKIVTFGHELVKNYTSHYILEEDPRLNLSSKYQQPVSGETTAALSVLKDTIDVVSKGATSKFAFVYKQFGFQIWTGSDPITMSLSIGLFMEDDSYEEVIKPARDLMKVPLPFVINDQGGLGMPGPNIVEGMISSLNGGGLGGYTVKIGNWLTLNDCVITKVEPTFSKEIDATGNPIWCRLQVDISSLELAHRAHLKNIGAKRGESVINQEEYNLDNVYNKKMLSELKK